jgi:hypothetical protein
MALGEHVDEPQHLPQVPRERLLASAASRPASSAANRSACSRP